MRVSHESLWLAADGLTKLEQQNCCTIQLCQIGNFGLQHVHILRKFTWNVSQTDTVDDIHVLPLCAFCQTVRSSMAAMMETRTLLSYQHLHHPDWTTAVMTAALTGVLNGAYCSRRNVSATLFLYRLESPPFLSFPVRYRLGDFPVTL